MSHQTSDGKRPALTFRLWDNIDRERRIHVDCTIMRDGDGEKYEWRCREYPTYALSRGDGGKEEAKYDAIRSFGRSPGFYARWDNRYPRY